jgi:hypothetical protein
MKVEDMQICAEYHYVYVYVWFPGAWCHCVVMAVQCCRFDALDAAVDGRWPAQWPGQPAANGSSSSSSSGGGCASSTAVVMRALHGLPAGAEVTLSYFPLQWDLQERQAQAQQVRPAGVVMAGGCTVQTWSCYRIKQRCTACLLLQLINA